MPDLDNAACFPVCFSCREAGSCVPPEVIARQVKRDTRKTRTPWAPNKLDPVKLVCGHIQIPWPIVTYFGKNITVVDCETCGTEVPYKEVKKTMKQKPKVMIDEGEVLPF